MISIKGQRGTLRQASLRDIDLVLRWENDPQVMAEEGILEKKGYDDIACFLLRNQEFDLSTVSEGRFIFENLDHEPHVFLDFFNRRGKTLELGILVFGPEHRGMGYGTSALECFKLLSPKFGIDEITVQIEDSNTASIRLFTKCGFKSGSTKDGIKKYSCTL